YELAALGIVRIRQQGRHRHFDEIGIAVERLAIGISKLRSLDDEMNEIGPGRIETVEIESFEQCKLLHGYRSLAPRTGLAHGVAFVVVGQWRFDVRRPARHIVASEHAAVAIAA